MTEICLTSIIENDSHYPPLGVPVGALFFLSARYARFLCTVIYCVTLR